MPAWLPTNGVATLREAPQAAVTVLDLTTADDSPYEWRLALMPTDSQRLEAYEIQRRRRGGALWEPQWHALSLLGVEKGLRQLSLFGPDHRANYSLMKPKRAQREADKASCGFTWGAEDVWAFMEDNPLGQSAGHAQHQVGDRYIDRHGFTHRAPAGAPSRSSLMLGPDDR
jgi:hypothetical protein